ncbi:MAG TPA: hypothetical protein VHY91_17355 [Pirellulales bacterium]|jgi:hypothetical protein|nr:hypothetical protein [Pirellulales bacterium]
MPFNRINGFYAGGADAFQTENMTVTLDERNDEVNQALDARFAQLKDVWDRHAEALKAMRPVESVSCIYLEEFDDEDNPHVLYYYHFGFWRGVGGAWVIYHGTSDSYDERAGIEWQPIHETSARNRVKAAHYIDKLREAIIKSKEKFIGDMDAAIATLAKGLDSYKS